MVINFDKSSIEANALNLNSILTLDIDWKERTKELSQFELEPIVVDSEAEGNSNIMKIWIQNSLMNSLQNKIASPTGKSK